MLHRWLSMALGGAILLVVAGCAISGEPVEGTPFGIEERSHGHP